MKSLSGNAIFSSFDLEEIARDVPDLLFDLMAKLKQMRNIGQTRPIPHTSFDVWRIEEAFKYFIKATRTGKIVLSYQDESPLVWYRGPLHQVRFSLDNAYLLVGCLGGLGRASSRWIVD